MAPDTHKPDGVQVSQDEARELERQSHDTWHWREVDLRDWMTKRLGVLFKGRQLVDTATESVEIFKTELYGEAFATSRKGQTEATCNLDCRIYWRGKVLFNGGIVGTANGTIKFPEVVANCSADEWPMKILADGEDPSAMRMLNPCGSMEETQLRPLEPCELKLREAAERCEGELRGLMAKLIQDMAAHAAGEPVGEVCLDKEKSQEEISEKVRLEVEGKMEEMRVQALPEKFNQVMQKLNESDVPERIELSVARITDVEVAKLMDALKGDKRVTHLNMAFNQITDIGIQALVTALATGSMKELKEVNVSNNQFSEIGVRMLSGVGMMRKGLHVISESAISHITAKPSI